MPRGSAAPRVGTLVGAVIEAVLFDWGDTLMEWRGDDELLAAGHLAGLDAIGRGDLAITEHFVEHYLPLFWVPGTIEEIEYPGLVRRLLAEFDIRPSNEELDAFLEAEHAAW